MCARVIRHETSRVVRLHRDYMNTSQCGLPMTLFFSTTWGANAWGDANGKCVEAIAWGVCSECQRNEIEVVDEIWRQMVGHNMDLKPGWSGVFISWGTSALQKRS